MAKAKILIVEDEGITALHIERILERHGYVVVAVAASCEDALLQVSADAPDLVLMDIQLKGEMDGIEAAQIIRDSFNIPVVYLTAHSDEATLARAKITEPFGYVLKPFESRELVSNIEMALYKHGVENKLRELAHYDMLTGLPNRTLLFDRINQAIRQSKRNQRVIALIMLDLDGFKNINDAMGHEAGDLVLKEVAARLRGCIRDSDTAARLGGDEFVVVLTNLSKPLDAEPIASKIIVTVGRPLDAALHCSIGASLGISFYPTDGDDVATLVKKADVAMYRVKGSGKNGFHFFGVVTDGDMMGNRAGTRLRIAIALASAFVLRQEGVWGHYDWIAFLVSVKDAGVDLTAGVEIQLGTMLESLKGLYLMLAQSGRDMDVTLPYVCNEAGNFITGNNGIWTHDDWDRFFIGIEAGGVELDEAITTAIGDIIEAARALLIYLQ